MSNADCPNFGLGDGSLTPSCQTVELESSIFQFDPFVPNNRGDCPSNASLASVPDCQLFQGEFKFLQSIPTKGLRSMHYFAVKTTETTHHFLAVAEHRDDNMHSVDSSVWRWKGRQFGLFQRS